MMRQRHYVYKQSKLVVRGVAKIMIGHYAVWFNSEGDKIEIVAGVILILIDNLSSMTGNWLVLTFVMNNINTWLE